MNKKYREFKINHAIVLLLFSVFAMCMLVILLLGAQTYSKLLETNEQNYEKRTAVQYLTTKIRQNDKLGGISLGLFDGEEALVLREEIHGKSYETWIYCCDGYIREIFTSDIAGFDPEDGNKILEAENVTFSKEDGQLLVVFVGKDGTEQKFWIQLRSGKEFGDER